MLAREHELTALPGQRAKAVGGNMGKFWHQPHEER